MITLSLICETKLGTLRDDDADNDNGDDDDDEDDVFMALEWS